MIPGIKTQWQHNSFEPTAFNGGSRAQLTITQYVSSLTQTQSVNESSCYGHYVLQGTAQLYSTGI